MTHVAYRTWKIRVTTSTNFGIPVYVDRLTSPDLHAVFLYAARREYDKINKLMTDAELPRRINSRLVHKSP
jgi:hypothetical protein